MSEMRVDSGALAASHGAAASTVLNVVLRLFIVWPIWPHSVSTSGMRTWKMAPEYKGRHSVKKPTQLSSTGLLLVALKPAWRHFISEGGGGGSAIRGSKLSVCECLVLGRVWSPEADAFLTADELASISGTCACNRTVAKTTSRRRTWTYGSGSSRDRESLSMSSLAKSPPTRGFDDGLSNS